MASVGLHPYSGCWVCISVPNQRSFSATRLMPQRPCQAVPIQSANLVDVGLLAIPRAARSPLLVPHRRSCRRSRLIPVRSAAVSQAQQAFRQSQSGDVRPLTSLLVPAVAGLLLSKVVDGKGIMLATYWAARYFVPAVVSLWLAKQAHKHWDSVSAVVVMAASYAASMAVSYRLLAGSTTTIKLYYPLFSGKVTIPWLVAKWIRHNNNLAKFLTKMLAFGPWVLLSLAAALQLAVWLDANGRHTKAKDSKLPQGLSCQSTLSPEVASASGTPTFGPVYEHTESAGPQQEPANGETHHEAQKAVIAGTNAQDHSQEEDEEHVRCLPSQAEHMAHVVTSRSDAVQKGKTKEGAEDEDKEGCHADGNTHGLSTDKRHSTEALLERVYIVGEEDSDDDLFDSSEEEEDLSGSSDEEEDSDNWLCDSSDEEEGIDVGYVENYWEEDDSDDEDCQVIQETGGAGKDSLLTVTQTNALVRLMDRDSAGHLDTLTGIPETTREKFMTAWCQGNCVPSISVRKKLTSILEKPANMEMQSLQNEKSKVQQKLREANSNKAQLTAQLAQLSADQEAKVNELLREVDQLEREHTREVEDIEDNLAQELTEAQREHEDEVKELERQHAEGQRDHEDEVAQLESRVALLERELEGLQTQKTNIQKLQAAHEGILKCVLVIYNQHRGHDERLITRKLWNAIDEMHEGAYFSGFQPEPLESDSTLEVTRDSKGMTSEADKWAKIDELCAEIEKIEGIAYEHVREMEDIENSHTEELNQVQSKHEGEVAELKSRVVQLEQEAKGLKEAEDERQAAQQVKASSQQVPEHKPDQIFKAGVQALQELQAEVDRHQGVTDKSAGALERLKEQHAEEVKETEETRADVSKHLVWADHEHAEQLKEPVVQYERRLGRLEARQQVQRKHMDELAELQSRVAQYEQEVKNLSSHKRILEVEGPTAHQQKGGEQQLSAVEQIKELQAELGKQAKSHQQAQEALAIEEKCKRDQLQAEVDRLQAVAAQRMTRWQFTPERGVEQWKPLDSVRKQRDATEEWERKVKVMAAGPSPAAFNDVHAEQTGTEGEAAAAAAATVSGSPETTLMISDDGDVLVCVEPAATAPKNDTAASTAVQVPDGSSGRRSGNADVEDAPAASVQTVAEAPSVVVQISDIDKGTTDGEVKVNIVSTTPIQKPAEPVALSVDISDGYTDKADGSVKVDVTAVTAAQTAGAHKSETSAGTASGQQGGLRSNSLVRPSLAELLPDWPHGWDGEAHVGNPGRLGAGTGIRKAGSQPSKMSNWLVDDSNQAGSEMDAGRASGHKASKSDEKAIESASSGTGSDEDDDTVVQVTVDRSLLG